MEIAHDGVTLRIDSRKAQALLAYLVVEQRPVSRMALLGMFWPDMPEDRGRANLSWTLNRLNALLPGLISAERSSVRFLPAETTVLDCMVFRQHAARAEPLAWALAVEQYRGPLLDGLQLTGCADFEHWLLIERERFEQQVIDLLARLAEWHAGNRAPEAAAEALGRLLALDPLREDAHRQRMWVLALAGQRAAALAQYERCREILRAELGAEPALATVAMAEQIRSGRDIAPRPTGAERPRQMLPHPPPAALIGRRAELQSLARLLDTPGVRLVTIAGLGGIGKTSLALAYAEHVAPRFHDGTRVVALAALDAAALLPAAIAESLGYDLHNHPSPHRVLLDLLRDAELLLVLDNMEHLPAAADLLADILVEAPGVKLLLTSQERLGLREERVFDLGGLGLPAEPSAAAVLASESGQLFVHHASRVLASFAVDGENEASVAQICTMLGGHPLAIELAASWVRSLSCDEIAQEIAAGMDFLSTTMRDLPARHRSVRSVFAYSWDRLSEDERRAFALLSVFPSDFSSHAARALLGVLTFGLDMPASERRLRNLIAALVDRSLVVRLRGGRYTLHGLLRSFAAEKLGAGDMALARSRHWAYFGELLCAREAALRGADVQGGLATLTAEFANIRAGWLWAIHHPDSLMLRAAESLLLFYDTAGRFRDGAELFAETAAQLERMERPADRVPLLGRARTRQGLLLIWLGGYADAQRCFEQGLRLANTFGDRREQALALAGLAFAQRWLGHLSDAERLGRDALALARDLGDRWLIATALQYLALICRDLGVFAEARAYAQECRALFHSFGYRRGVGFALTVLGLVEYDTGSYAEAERMFHEGYGLCAAVGDPMGTVIAEHYLGVLALSQGRFAEARQRLGRALAESRRLGYQWGGIRAQIQLGVLARAESRLDEADQRLAAAMADAQSIGALPLLREASAIQREWAG